MKKTLLLAALLTSSVASFAQWPSSADGPFPLVSSLDETDYSRDMRVNSEGTTYVLKLVPGTDEGGAILMSYRLHIVDKNGNVLTSTDQGRQSGIEVCTTRNRSSVVVNDLLYIDKNDNVLVVVNDCRNTTEDSHWRGYTLYKLDKDGNKIWEHDLMDGMTYQMPVRLSVTETTDGGYVCAFQDYQSNNNNSIFYEKLDKDGNSLWQKHLTSTSGIDQQPYLVTAENNEVIMVYASGTNEHLYAVRIDQDGEVKWSTRFYRGGFDSIPLWTHLRVTKGPKDGVLVAWRDDRSYCGWYSGYLNFIDGEGNIAYPNDMDAIQIAYPEDGISTYDVSIDHSDKDNATYTAYRLTDQASQSWHGINVQKVTDQGELLWNVEGEEVVPFEYNNNVGNIIVKEADQGCIVFYFFRNGITSFSDAELHAAKVDNDGHVTWDIILSNTTSYKAHLFASQLIDGDHWIISWEDRLDNPSNNNGVYDRFACRLNVDGTMGEPTEAINTVSVPKGVPATYYNIAGERLSAPVKGINIVQTAQGVRKVFNN